MTEKKLFENMGLQSLLVKALDNMQITIPTEIQSKVIEPALDGKDIIGTSKTGTGKTLAFLIPLFTYLKNNPAQNALILAPTRELAAQINDVVKEMFGSENPFYTVVLVGGANMQRQLRELKNKPRLVIGTPGRIRDMLQQKALSFARTSFVVLDETDRMLDMGFIEDINVFISLLPAKRQMLLFSATMPPSIEVLAKTYLNNPVRISVGETHTAHESISQNHREVKSDEKFSVLVEELNKRGGSTLVFVKTKYIAARTCKNLKKEGFNCGELHSNMSQNQRKNTLQNFRDEKIDILVATDLASRGIDIDHIQNVINYDVPFVPHDYIHRVGRTGRAGREGFALTLVSNEDKKLWKQITNLLGGKDKGGNAKHTRVIKKIKDFKTNPKTIDSRVNNWQKKSPAKQEEKRAPKKEVKKEATAQKPARQAAAAKPARAQQPAKQKTDGAKKDKRDFKPAGQKNFGKKQKFGKNKKFGQNKPGAAKKEEPKKKTFRAGMFKELKKAIKRGKKLFRR